jgi:hypothetical protein
MLPKPSATSASKELADLVRAQSKRKLVGYSSWPRYGSEVLVACPKLGGLLVRAELLSLEIDYGEARRFGKLRVTDEFEGLSEGLRAMMPKTVTAHLIDLKKPVDKPGQGA